MSHNNEHTDHHITPFNTYVKVAAALFFLTFLTVGAHLIKEHIEPFAALVAFVIAAVKAGLVMTWFMHMKSEVPSNRIIFSMGFIFLALLFGLSVLDILTRIHEASVL
jgi:cytochrome c oxidase subunit 4